MNRPQFTLYRGAAVADATSPGLQKDMSVLVADNRILAIRPTPDEGILPPDVRIIDAGGSTIVPGMVDAHSHVTLPGGSHWIDRGFDPPEELLRVAEHNGDLLSRAGVRWARDVGSPAAADPRDGRMKALALQVRERWRADPSRPKIRVAGTWIAHSGVLQPGLDIEADDGPALLAAAKAQLEDGADLLKLYLDGPKKEEAPWSVEDVRAVVDHADPSICQRRGEGAHRPTTGASDRERPLGPPRRRPDRGGDGLRRRVPPGQPPRVGGRIARRGGAPAMGGPRRRDRPRRRTPRRPRRGPNLRGGPRGLLPRPWRSARRSDRPVAGVARGVAHRSH